MDQCIEYLKSNNYVLIDVTKLMTAKSYLKYALLASKRTNVILYFKRTNTTEFFFKSANSQTNYCFLNKDNYFWCVIDNTFDVNLKRSINEFLKIDTALLECGICFNEKQYLSRCSTCSFGICNTCIDILGIEEMKNTHELNVTIKCPHCRQILDGEWRQ